MASPIRWRIILPFALLTTTASALFGWAAAERVGAQVEGEVRGGLKRLVIRLAASRVPLEPGYLPFMAALADARILALEERGGIQVSSLDPKEFPAWKEALSGLDLPVGAPAERVLKVGGEDFLAAWVRLPGEGPAAVLAAVPFRRVAEARRAAAGPVLWLAALQGAAAIAIGAVVAASLTRPLARLSARARRIAAGDLEGASGVKSPDEIGLLAETLDGMAASLKKAQADLVQAERMAVLGRLAAGLAHEIRNPLSSVRMQVQVLARGPGVDPATRDLILAEIDRLEGILSELLAWARPSGLSLSEVDLAALAEEALTLMAPQFEHRGIRVERRIAPVPGLRADRDRLRQVLRNLLANARDALGTGGMVRVLTSPAPGGGGLLEVSDDGPGIPPGIRERVFEPFVTGRKDGTGLGLAIVKRAVEEQGGEISVETGERGTAFRVVLPKEGGSRG